MGIKVPISTPCRVVPLLTPQRYNVKRERNDAKLQKGTPRHHHFVTRRDEVAILRIFPSNQGLPGSSTTLLPRLRPLPEINRSAAFPVPEGGPVVDQRPSPEPADIMETRSRRIKAPVSQVSTRKRQPLANGKGMGRPHSGTGTRTPTSRFAADRDGFSRVFFEIYLRRRRGRALFGTR